ncbi:MAG: hypothetical protein DWI51_00550 [Chloroflexi bacterium]|nr:MAG: hypothetical protein DWI45_03380 [Chloroflexota bacterium]RLT29855.1 MAG: hypothetical protein DWI51_00550 [Chloroflexota bacterium]
MKHVRLLALALAAVLLAVACGGSSAEPTGTPLYAVTRSWSNGIEESASIYADGRIVMHHSEHMERVTIPADQMTELAAAAAAGVAPGSNGDNPILGVSINGAAPVRPAANVPGSLTALLNLLLDSHTLHP